MKNQLSHVALLAADLARSIQVLERHGLPIGPIEDFAGEGTREAYVGELLLMQPMADGSYRRALEKRGPGLHHIALDLPNLRGFAQELVGSGWFLLPSSLSLATELNEIWLGRPGFPALIEVQERATMPARIETRIEKLEVPQLKRFEKLAAKLELDELQHSIDAQTWITLAGVRLSVAEIVGGKAIQMAQPTFETERLVLRPFCEKDIPDIFAYASQPEIDRYVTWSTHRSLEESRAFYEWVQSRNLGERGRLFFTFALVDKKSGHVIGSIGVTQPQEWTMQIDYALDPRHWGKGLMTEAALVMRDWIWANFPEVTRVQSSCMPENRGSSRVMEKIGLRFEGVRRQSFKAKDRLIDLAHYSLLRSDR